MLFLPLKPAVKFDIQTALASWLDNSEQQVSFQPTNPLQIVLPKPDYGSVACREELLRIQALRKCLSDALLKPNSLRAALDDNALEDAQEYHAVLLEFEKQGFPTLNDEHNGLKLVWKGAWAPQKEEHSTLLWDRSVITFNIVALLTYKACDCNVTDRAACKEAVGYCQQASSILAVLKELVQSLDFGTVDLSQSMLTFWEKYLLAEAQTFVYRMASLATDVDTKHGTLSFLAKSAHLLFNEALSAAQDPRLQSEVPKHCEQWGTYCKAQSMMCSAKAEYHSSVVYRLASEWGKEIFRLCECLKQLEAASKFLKSVVASGSTTTTGDDEALLTYTKRECSTYLPVVQDRLTEADRDNHRCYGDDIPKSLDDIIPKQLVKKTGGYPQSMLVPKKKLFQFREI